MRSLWPRHVLPPPDPRPDGQARPAPSGGPGSRTRELTHRPTREVDMPRFVILEHDHPVLHWDFMLEVGDVLRTWRLAAPPAAGMTVPAEPSFDHRKLYLD